MTGRALERLNSRLEHLAKVGERVEKHLIRQTRRSARRLNLSGTAGDVLGRLRPIESGLTALGVPKSFLNRLHDDNQRLAAAVRSRNQELAKEARDTQKLINARQAMRQDRSAFRGAISGTFDITAAGANAAGKVTGLGIVAQAKQAVSRAKLWISGMKRLVHLKIFPASYLRDLFAKGPDSLDQVNALVNLPMGELKQLADAQAQLAHLSGVGAGLGTTKLDQGAVTRAQRQVHRDKQIENRREKHLEHVKDEIVHAIDHALDRLEPVSDVQLVGMVNRGQRKAKRR